MRTPMLLADAIVFFEQFDPATYSGRGLAAAFQAIDDYLNTSPTGPEADRARSAWLFLNGNEWPKTSRGPLGQNAGDT